MSNEGPFRTPPEELAVLTREVAEIRAVLRDLVLRLNQIERHARRAFGVRGESKPKPRKSTPRPALDSPAMSAEDALRFFDQLVEMGRGESAEGVQQRLYQLGIADLRLLAQELGLPGGTRPSKRAIVTSILGRVRESIMLSKNINVTAPRSETPAGSAEGSS